MWKRVWVVDSVDSTLPSFLYSCYTLLNLVSSWIELKYCLMDANQSMKIVYLFNHLLIKPTLKNIMFGRGYQQTLLIGGAVISITKYINLCSKTNIRISHLVLWMKFTILILFCGCLLLSNTFNLFRCTVNVVYIPWKSMPRCKEVASNKYIFS